MRKAIATTSQFCDAIDGFIDEHGYSPSLRELADMLGYRSPSAIKHHLDRMRASGIVDYADNIPRTLRVVRHV